jgi:hypothetical protein
MFALKRMILALLTLFFATAVATAQAATMSSPMIGPVPVDFVLFALVLAGVALFHNHSLRVAVAMDCRDLWGTSDMNGCCWPTCSAC